METILALSALGLFLAMALYATLMILWLRIDMYFLKFKIEKHPVLQSMIEDTIVRILKEENLSVFFKTYEELNKGKTKDKEKALGMYVYTRDAEHQKKNDYLREEIEQLEREWHKPIAEICKLVGANSTLDKEDYTLPKILMCKDSISLYGYLAYYATFFHEIGHHISIKYNDDRTEDGADAVGYKLVIENFPFFFQLFPFLNFRHRLDMDELTIFEKLRAYYQFLRYLRINRKK
jgi:hypothetical protein